MVSWIAGKGLVGRAGPPDAPGPPAPLGPPGSAGPLPPDESRAGEVYAIVIPFLIVAILFYAARIYTRVRVLRCLWWDDWALSVAMIACTISGVLQVITPSFGFARHVYYTPIEHTIKAGKYAFVIQNLYALNVSLIKGAIALQLIRIKQEPRWIWGLSAFIIFLAITYVAALAVNLAQCTPIEANWNIMAVNMRCWPASKRQLVFYTFSAVYITTDLVLAALPVAFIRHIRRPMREKIILMSLMGLGIFATAANIVKMVLLINFKNLADASWELVGVGVWSHVELYVGIIAACVPCLKAMLQRALQRLGLLSTKEQSDPYSHELSKTSDKIVDQRLQELNLQAAPQHGSEVELMDASGQRRGIPDEEASLHHDANISRPTTHSSPAVARDHTGW